MVSAAAIVMFAVSGCTSRQMYNTGQEYQRNQCERLLDQTERQRCLERADTTYDDYKRETGGQSGK